MPTKRRGRRALLYVFFLTVAWAILWGVSLHRLSASEFFWITVLYLFCSLPAVLFVAGHPFRIPLMPMWGLGYFFMFGMPMLSEELRSALDFFVPEATMVSALRLAALGAGMCLLAFYTPLGGWMERLVPHVRAPWDPDRAPLLGVCLALIGFGINYYRLSSEPPLALGQLLFIGSQLATVGMLTLFLLQLRGQLSWQLRLLLWGAMVPVEFLLSIGTGAVWQVISRLAPLLFCYTAEHRRIPWQVLAFGALCIIPLYGTKMEFRSYLLAETEEPASSPLQRGMAFLELTTQRFFEKGGEAYTTSSEVVQARVGHLPLLATMMQMTPAVIPFWGGETYQTLLWTFVPRMLFPGKPEKTLGQEFGHRYGLLAEDDFTTSINLPYQVVEMYINFGNLGVLIGMAMVGCLYRAIAALLGYPEAGERALVIGCALSANLLSLDSDFSLVFGGIVYYVLLMYIAVRILQPRAHPSALAES